MIRHNHLTPTFVKHIPKIVEQGLLYISMDYATAVHSCCCGCGEEVVTPFTPTDWNMTFDGETISLSPSIGSWSLPCKSHYIIRRNRIIVAGAWTNEQILKERQRDQKAKADYYRTTEVTSGISSSPSIHPPANGVLRRLWNWIKDAK